MGKQWGVQVEPRCGHEVEAIEGQLQPLPASLAGGDGDVAGGLQVSEEEENWIGELENEIP